MFFGFVNGQSVKFDSIIKLRELAQDNNLEFKDQLVYALQASKLSEQTKIDSTILRSNRILAFVYLNLDNFKFSKKINQNNLKLAYKLNDSSSIAAASFNLGWMYHEVLQNDSAYYYYYNALKINDKLGKTITVANLLQNIASIQSKEKDYTMSEQNAIKAIALIQQLPKTDQDLDSLWSLYNLLGIISDELKNYDKAIEYHEKALNLSRNFEDPYYYEIFSNNNIASAYMYNKKYDKAYLIYKNIKESEGLKKNDPSLYSILLGNYAESGFLAEQKTVEETEILFSEAYKIADSINDVDAIMKLGKDFANFYYIQDDYENANLFASIAYQKAKDAKNFEILLTTQLILSKVSKGNVAKQYLYEHIALNDSLLNNERTTRNKFARIKFETDQIEAENEQISRENLMLLVLSSALVLALLLVYLFISQRAKNKEIQFVKQQQESNEEIYNLMLAQQDKIDEGRTQEKKRISEELHDGILGRLFGTRLSLDSLNLVHTEEAIKNRSNYINELKTIELEIRKISHDLNTDFIANSGFLDIIKTLIETQTKAYQLRYDFYHNEDIDWDEVSNKNKIHLYRIIQESLQNIYKHASASHVKISFQLKNDVILVSIKDNGSGFNINKAKKGIGLKNINSRVTELNGKLTIKSILGEGTEILINVPI